MEVIEYDGFHGTSKKNALKIIKEQEFIPGNDTDNEDFLGKGIYFFEKYQHAILWNIKSFKDKRKVALEYKIHQDKYAVMKAKIVVKRENLLDLEDVRDIVRYDKICKKIEDVFNGDTIYKNARYKDRAIINYLYTNKLMDNIYIIRKVFGQRMNVDKLNVSQYLEREVLCVKNHNVIKKIDLLNDINKEEYNDIKYLAFVS